jgi:g-D-glutamyl-meso-diaminopimelate peptidase
MGDCMDGYDYQTLRSDVLALYKDFPFLTVSEIGKSLCGRSLYLLEIGRGEPVLLAGAFHGMEHITSAVLMRLLRELCLRFARGENIGSHEADSVFLHHKACFVPCVNPDGVEISLYGPDRAGEYSHIVRRFSSGDTSAWQANARGVDLNHNFNAGWDLLRQIEKKMGFDFPGPTRFGGFFPDSEPEVQALEALCIRKKFRRVLACHSQGEEIYYAYGEKTPPESLYAARQMASLARYRVSHPEEEIASHGGFKDWFIQQFGNMGFTVELGKGKNPLPLSSREEIFARTQDMFFTFISMP